MAIASLNEVIQSYIQRRNAMNLDLTNYSNQKTLSVARQSDLAGWKNVRNQALRTQYKDVQKNAMQVEEGFLYNGQTFVDYSEIPEYKDEVQYVDNYYEARIEDLTAWETQLDNQITTMNVELNEINAYIDSFKQTLSANIKADYAYGTDS